MRRSFVFAWLALAVCLACASNPATGKRQLMLVGQDQEIDMGRQADKDVIQSIGLYEDERVQAYVQRIGQALAARSEMPDLKWTFRVVDDPSVNAFAVPGGFVYVTRGIMTYLNSEAELAAVMGHEIGHVTARHSASQMSKAQIANLGLVVGMAARPELAKFGNLAQTSLGLLFLKFSRDDERQADDLGLRYLTRASYDPRPMTEVFQTLERIGDQESQGRLPSWLSTHPDPGERVERISAEVAKMRLPPQGRVDRAAYMGVIEGMVFGPDPREGYFEGSAFYHPELKFTLKFPAGWKAQNQKQAVGAVSPSEDAAEVLSLTGAATPDAAAREFFNQKEIRAGETWTRDIHGMPTVARAFEATVQQGTLRGLAAFVEHDGKVYSLLGYTPAERFGAYDSLLAESIKSFDALTDPRRLQVQPKRLDIVQPQQAMTLEEFQQKYPSSIDLRTLALINHLDPNDPVEPGEMLKRVVGGAGDAGRASGGR